MPTHASQTLPSFVQDARTVAAAARKRLKDFAAWDGKAKKKSVTKALLDALDKDVERLVTLGTTKQGQARTALRATNDEAARRQVVAERLKILRDRVATHAPDDLALQKAWGRGKELNTKSTPKLLALADDFAAAFAVDAKAVAPLGVGPADLAALKKERAALAAADHAQGDAIGARFGATAALKTLRARVEKTLAWIRKTARAMDRTAPKAERAAAGRALASKAARRTSKTRLKKPVASPVASKKTA